jgi:hypothetical protein
VLPLRPSCRVPCARPTLTSCSISAGLKFKQLLRRTSRSFGLVSDINNTPKGKSFCKSGSESVDRRPKHSGTAYNTLAFHCTTVYPQNLRGPRILTFLWRVLFYHNFLPTDNERIMKGNNNYYLFLRRCSVTALHRN